MFGPGTEYIYEELSKISNVSSEDTQEIKTLSDDCIEKEFNWEPLYGKLDVGRYKFILDYEEDSQGVIVYFSIDEKGNISYNEPEFMF